MHTQEPKHAKPTIFAGDVRRGTVLLSDTGTPQVVLSVGSFYGDSDHLVVTTRLFGSEYEDLNRVKVDSELNLASISTAEFLLWEFSEYATLEGMMNDRRYQGQLAE